MNERAFSVKGERMYRSKFFNDNSKDRSVLEIALDVTMAARGSYTRTSEDQEVDALLLKEILKTWKPENYSSILDTHFDRCVKSVIEASLALHQDRYGVK